MAIGLEVLPVILLYVTVGASVRAVWGVYKVYTTYLFIRIKWVRVLTEIIAGIFFGLFGAFTLSSLVPIQFGIELAGLFSAVLGANVINILAKKFGVTKHFEVVVSDQQLGVGELNNRQLNAIEFAKREGKITNGVYQKINNVGRSTAKWELKKLVEKHAMKQVKSGKGTAYIMM